MPRPAISTLLGYVVSAVTVTVGMLVLCGVLLPASVPGQVRVMFGVVIVLLGLYRASITYVRSLQANRKLYE